MVQLELSPGVEERLHKAAAARGLQPEAYAAQVIESAVQPLSTEKPRTQQQIEKFLADLASIGEGKPALSEYALTRESFYEDHD